MALGAEVEERVRLPRGRMLRVRRDRVATRTARRVELRIRDDDARHRAKAGADGEGGGWRRPGRAASRDAAACAQRAARGGESRRGGGGGRRRGRTRRGRSPRRRSPQTGAASASAGGWFSASVTSSGAHRRRPAAAEAPTVRRAAWPPPQRRRPSEASPWRPRASGRQACALQLQAAPCRAPSRPSPTWGPRALNAPARRVPTRSHHCGPSRRSQQAGLRLLLRLGASLEERADG